ncbi:hypothetical protein BV898_00330 [Hypsibius exemplaris]|uniref:Uncharacterized protein n=1 Tax=Hypsibius exemplaris TaxID=2072580 RepID=A0A1W0XFS9_HYPEX|nr:hypothetical protein BV898_00330 [Hypsibius exemplaris]
MELPKPKYGATLMPTMQYLQAPGMRGLRSPSRESIASDFSAMSMSSRLGGVDGSNRRKRLQYMSKSRETLNSNFDQMSLNVSVDIPSLQMRRPDQDFLVPGQNAFVKPHQGMTRSFSFTDIRSAPLDQDDALREGPAAVSDPSLSVNSDFDDEISMFFDDKGEPINFNERSGAAERISAVACYDEAELIGDGVEDGVLVSNAIMTTGGKRSSKLRHRIKRKFLNFSFNELLRRRRSKNKSASSVAGDAAADRASLASGNSPSPKPENKRVHVNVFPEPETMKTLTDRDIEREQGKALSKYSRNLMIFNWLHNTEETWFHSQMQ